MAKIITVLPGGLKVCEHVLTLENTGTAAADVSGSFDAEHVNKVYSCWARSEDTNNAGVVLTITAPKTVNVTAKSVPAGESTKIVVIYVGY